MNSSNEPKTQQEIYPHHGNNMNMLYYHIFIDYCVDYSIALPPAPPRQRAGATAEIFLETRREPTVPTADGQNRPADTIHVHQRATQCK